MCVAIITCFSQFVKLVLRASRNAWTVQHVIVQSTGLSLFSVQRRPKRQLMEPQPDNMPRNCHRLPYAASHFIKQLLIQSRKWLCRVNGIGWRKINNVYIVLKKDTGWLGHNYYNPKTEDYSRVYLFDTFIYLFIYYYYYYYYYFTIS